MKKSQFVRDLDPGDRVLSPFAVTYKRLLPHRPDSDQAGDHYLRLGLQDRTGSIAAVIWSEANPTASHEHVESGGVVAVKGRVESYQGRRQVVVDHLQVLPLSQVNRRHFQPVLPVPRKPLVQSLHRAVESVDRDDDRRLLDDFFGSRRFRRAFARSPATRRHHHAYLGGLLHHTVQVTRLVSSLVKIYLETDDALADLDRDLVVTAALLHGAGRPRAYDIDSLTFDLTEEGRLYGPVMLGVMLLRDRIRTLEAYPAERARRLEHMVLSQDGRREWGAPRRPATAEARLLHHAHHTNAQLHDPAEQTGDGA